MPPVEVAAARLPARVERDGTDRAEHRLAAGLLLATQHALEFQPSTLGREVVVGHGLESLLERELFRAGAGKHDVRRPVHHQARELDRAAHVTHAGHRAGAKVAAVHDRRVEFVLAVRGEHRTAARVEERIVLEHLHGGDDRVETRCRRARGRRNRRAARTRVRREKRARLSGVSSAGGSVPAPPWTAIASIVSSLSSVAHASPAASFPECRVRMTAVTRQTLQQNCASCTRRSRASPRRARGGARQAQRSCALPAGTRAVWRGLRLPAVSAGPRGLDPRREGRRRPRAAAVSRDPRRELRADQQLPRRRARLSGHRRGRKRRAARRAAEGGVRRTPRVASAVPPVRVRAVRRATHRPDGARRGGGVPQARPQVGGARCWATAASSR